MEDDRLIKALAHANYKATLVQQRENLKICYINNLIYAQNGGLFTVDSSLLSMVDLLIRSGQTEAVIVDDKSTPIKIDNLKEFLEKIISVYYEASNDYYVSFEKLRKARNVESLIK